MRHHYILFYKPYGVASQFTAGAVAGRRTLKEFIPVGGVYAAGRLDHDSEGLLLLTDDGAFQHLLTDPRYGHPRTYWVQVENVPGEPALRRLAEGVTIQGVTTRPAQVKLLAGEPGLPPRDPPVRYRARIPTCWLELTITEGRNRQVRRMTAAAGHPTLRLVRVAIGELRLEGLAPGEWRELRPEEVRRIRKLTSARPAASTACPAIPPPARK